MHPTVILTDLYAHGPIRALALSALPHAPVQPRVQAHSRARRMIAVVRRPSSHSRPSLAGSSRVGHGPAASAG